MRKLIMVVTLFTMISGCKSSSSTEVNNSSIPLVITSTITPPIPTATSSAKESDTKPTSPQEASIKPTPTKVANSNETITLGEYAVEDESPFNYGSAIITTKGNGLYHLKVDVLRLYSHHNGEMESDFNFISGKIRLLDEEMTDVQIIFSDNKLIIDYPESISFGGANAEPKGTYFLKNTGIEDNEYLNKLFDSVNLGESYRNGFTDVYVTALVGSNQLMLLLSKSSINRSNIVSENVVVYNEKEKKFNFIGEVSDDFKKLNDKLKVLEFDQDTIYRTLRKDANDRYIKVRMNNFDNGEKDAILKPLTVEEAFFVAIGEEGKTRISTNRRDKDNIGSIFITEVDHSDDETVTIHTYEEVRNDDKDVHTATSDWIAVDRLNGKVKGLLDQ